LLKRPIAYGVKVLKNNYLRITSRSVEETRAIGEEIGRQIKSGIIIALTGDLGAGKTAFIQGLAKGLEVSENCYITSPTYTLINEYAGKLPLLHVDLYRLDNPDDFEDIGLYEAFDGNNVVAIEWAEKIAKEAFPEYIEIRIDFNDEETRDITINAYGPKTIGLMEEIKKSFSCN
jgi:tRNA threonylcarbamoyladenosine biosynthesis protein TsaE